MEFHALAQGEGPDLRIVRGPDLLRHAGHDLARRRHVGQPVARRHQIQERHLACRQRRIERVGAFAAAKAHLQCAALLRAFGAHRLGKHGVGHEAGYARGGRLAEKGAAAVLALRRTREQIFEFR